MHAQNVSKLILNYFADFCLYYRHSNVFSKRTYKKKESIITLHYHSIEKGFLQDQFRYRFGRDKVEELVALLKDPEIESNVSTQIAAGYLAACRYYEKHRDADISIEDYFRHCDYERLKRLQTLEKPIAPSRSSFEYFDQCERAFPHFAKSRASVRNFTGERIKIEVIKNVVELANTAPSVCNRQPNQVYVVFEKRKVDRILAIQQGLRGYTDDIHQLLVLVTDRSYYYSVGERNQMYIDGGLYLMNLLYSLHYHRIAACPAHWCLDRDHDKLIAAELQLPEAQKVICLIPIGIPKEHFRVTLSKRRSEGEVLRMVGCEDV